MPAELEQARIQNVERMPIDFIGFGGQILYPLSYSRNAVNNEQLCIFAQTQTTSSLRVDKSHTELSEGSNHQRTLTSKFEAN